MKNFSMDWMKEALFLAEQAATEDEVPVGAIVVQDSKIIGRGYNKREQQNNPVAHAEILAIQDAAHYLQSWRLNECILVVTLEPCMMCLAAAQQARLKEIVYGALDPKGGALSLGYAFNQDSKTNHRFTVTFLDMPECGQVLSRFFKKKRKANVEPST
jgi:tRNA(adenine34) deaminase